MEEEKDIEALEKQLMDFQQLKKVFVDRANDHIEARINLRQHDAVPHFQIVNEEMFMEVFKQLQDLKTLLQV